MIRVGKVAIAIAVLLLSGLAAPAAAQPAAATAVVKQITPQHDVVCTLSINTVIRVVNRDTVNVGGGWRCNASPDIAVTQITIQIRENGVWRDYGNPTVTASTLPNYNISDGAPMKPGCYAYRGEIFREAFHHNWGTHSKVGPALTFCT